MIGERFSHQIVYVKFWVNVDPCFLNDSEIIPHSESYIFFFCSRATINPTMTAIISKAAVLFRSRGGSLCLNNGDPSERGTVFSLSPNVPSLSCCSTLKVPIPIPNRRLTTNPPTRISPIITTITVSFFLIRNSNSLLPVNGSAPHIGRLNAQVCFFLFER